jgi:hypothetical protein
MDKMVVLVVALLVNLLGQQRVLVIHQVHLPLRATMVEQQSIRLRIMGPVAAAVLVLLALTVHLQQAAMEALVLHLQSLGQA